MHLSLPQILCRWLLSSPDLRAIRGLLKLHPPQRLLVICVIRGWGLQICLAAQINPGILEYSREEATIGEDAGLALTARYHMHHHQVPDMNPSPCQNGIHYESLKVGHLVSMSATWQQNGADHVMQDTADHCQAMCRGFVHPLGIGKSTQPLNSLSGLKSRHRGPHLGLIHPESN